MDTALSILNRPIAKQLFHQATLEDAIISRPVSQLTNSLVGACYETNVNENKYFPSPTFVVDTINMNAGIGLSLDNQQRPIELSVLISIKLTNIMSMKNLQRKLQHQRVHKQSLCFQTSLATCVKSQLMNISYLQLVTT